MKIIFFFICAVFVLAAIAAPAGYLFAQSPDLSQYEGCKTAIFGDKEYSSERLEEFRSLGQILKYLPLEGYAGYCPGWAKGVRIKVKEEFTLDSDRSDWTIEKDEENCKGKTGNVKSPCKTCKRYEECSLWLPDYWPYFEHP
jgi:hypothetical protein